MTRSGKVWSSWLGALAISLAGATAAADTLTIAASPNPAPAGTSVKFTFTPGVRSENDAVTFNFGDGTSTTIEFSVACALFGGCNTVDHTYAGPGTFTCDATGTIGGESVSGSFDITITASTADDELFIATGAHLKGFKNVNWRTDLEVNNPTQIHASYEVDLLLRDQDNSTPTYKRVYTLAPGRSVRYGDLLFATFGFSGAAAVRITPIDGAIIATSRTYNQLDSGTYGQSVPAIPRRQAIAFGQDARLIGLSHDPSLQSGYRTNLGLLNESPAGITVQADFRRANGLSYGQVSVDLLPFEFVQIDRAFERVTSEVVPDGAIIVRTTTAGAKFLAYAVVTDNITGDPTYVEAIVP